MNGREYSLPVDEVLAPLLEARSDSEMDRDDPFGIINVSYSF